MYKIEATLHIEIERNKLHNLANQYGMSDIRVLEQSQILDQCLNEYAMYLQVHSVDSWLP